MELAEWSEDWKELKSTEIWSNSRMNKSYMESMTEGIKSRNVKHPVPTDEFNTATI